MRLIFLRHGDAVNSGTIRTKDGQRALTDAGRWLSDDGIAALRRDLPYLAGWLHGRAVRIWTSPLTRAAQTADLLAELIPEAPVDTQNFLAQGSLSQLAGALQQLSEQGQTETIVLVGHEPTLSLWTEAITGRSVVMRKGGAAEIRIESLGPLQGQLIWASSPKEMAQFPLQLLQEPYQLVEEARQHFVSNYEDPESIHKLRVSIRRFRAVLSFLKPLVPRSAYNACAETYREMGRAAGLLRELDVLRETWHGIVQTEDTPLTRLLDRLRQEELGRMLDLFAQAKTIDQLSNAYDRLLSAGRKSKETVPAGDFISARLEQWRLIIDNHTEILNLADYRDIHSLRISCKKYRYVGELLQDLMPESDRVRVRAARRCQAELGDLCDAWRNPSALDELLAAEKNPEDGLEANIRRFSEVMDQRVRDFTDTDKLQGL